MHRDASSAWGGLHQAVTSSRCGNSMLTGELAMRPERHDLLEFWLIVAHIYSAMCSLRKAVTLAMPEWLCMVSAAP